MLYPVFVEPGDEKQAWSMVIPDFPGCFSAADEESKIPAMVQEAIEVWMDGESLALPVPSSIAALRHHPHYQYEGIWMLVDIDVSRIDPTPQRVNVSLPRYLLAEIDSYAKAHGATRSGFLAEAARAAMRQ